MKGTQQTYLVLVTNTITMEDMKGACYLGTQIEDEEVIDSMTAGRLISAIENHSLRVYKAKSESLARRRLGPSDGWIGPTV